MNTNTHDCVITKLRYSTDRHKKIQIDMCCDRKVVWGTVGKLGDQYKQNAPSTYEDYIIEIDINQ